MDLTLLFTNDALVEDILTLSGLGFSFDIEDGSIARIDFPKGWK